MVKPGLAHNHTLKFVLFLVILGLCWVLGRIFKIDAASAQEFFAQFPLMVSGLIFVALYVVTTTLVWFGPKDVLRISSAILFGGVVSSIYVAMGELANACIMFHLSRKLGREYVVERYKKRGRQIDAMGRDYSVLSIIAWRINPFVPFRLMDLGYGLTAITFGKYIAGIAVITFIRVLWLQTILAGIGTAILTEPTAIYDYMMSHQNVLQISAVYFLAIIVVTVIALIQKKVRGKRGSAAQ